MGERSFGTAVDLFLSTVALVQDDQWDAPGLGVWTVRDLVGHTSRAMLTVEEYATVGTNRAGFGDSSDIAERGREAGEALGDDPVLAVNEIAVRVLKLVDSLDDDHVVETPIGKRPLARYLRSRVTELTIHSIDLADAIHVTIPVPPEAMRDTLHSLADAALRLGVGKEVSFALTGRKPLKKGFTLVL